MFPEIRILWAGYQLQRQLEKDAEKGIDQKDRANLKKFGKKIQSGDWEPGPDPSEARETKTVEGVG